jgi:hypothetical protein
MTQKYALFFNSMAFGDTLFGINAARRFKIHNPDWKIVFTVRGDSNITTNEGMNGLLEALEVYSKQPWLDAVGFLKTDPQGNVVDVVINNDELRGRKPDLFVPQTGWWTDFGNNKSNNYLIKEYIPEETLDDGNLELFVESEKPNDGILRIGLNGPLDWNRKLQNEKGRLEVVMGIREILTSRNIKSEINMFGVEVNNHSMYQALCMLNRHNLFIGPIGSLHHASAALNLDTISIPSIFPTVLDTPAFYSTKGTHLTVEHRKENHCGVPEAKCLSTKFYKNKDTDKFSGQEGPFASLGFWPRKCPHTTSGWSCTKTVVPQDVLDTFESWLNEKYK